MPPNRLFFIENGFHQAKFGRCRVQNETILNVFPGANDQNRLVLVRTATICGREHLVLRQETHSPDIGWFVQSCVAIEPGQVAALKMTLAPSNVNRNVGTIGAMPVMTMSARTPSMDPRTTGRRFGGQAPVILRFDEAS